MQPEFHCKNQKQYRKKPEIKHGALAQFPGVTSLIINKNVRNYFFVQRNLHTT